MSSNNKKFEVSVTYDPFVIALSHVSRLLHFSFVIDHYYFSSFPVARFLSLPSLLYDTAGIVNEGEAIGTMARVNLEVS
jgi:hypothetical protein